MAEDKDPYFEVVYETGSIAVLHGPQEDVLRGLKDAHDRAKAGLPGTAASTPRTDLAEDDPIRRLADWTHAAERVKRVFVYDRHPADYSTDGLPADQVLSEAQAAIEASKDENGVVDMRAFMQKVSDIADPHKPDREERLRGTARHASMYKMEAREELDPSLWGGGD